MPLADCSRGTHAEGEASNEGCAIQAVVHGMAPCMATHKHIYICIHMYTCSNIYTYNIYICVTCSSCWVRRTSLVSSRRNTSCESVAT